MRYQSATKILIFLFFSLVIHLFPASAEKSLYKTLEVSKVKEDVISSKKIESFHLYPESSSSSNKLKIQVQLKHPINKYASDTRYALYAPTGTIWSTTTKIPEDATLYFSHGFLPEIKTIKESANISFLIVAQSENKKEILYKYNLNKKTKNYWQDKKVSLTEYSGKKIKLSFITRTNSGNSPYNSTSIWGYPRIKQKKGSSKTIIFSLRIQSLIQTPLLLVTSEQHPFSKN